MTRAPRLAPLLLLLATLATPARADDWRPDRTFAFFASTVTWEDPAFVAFNEPRRDDALVEQLVSDGVARDHLVYLRDKAATLDATRKELRALASRAGEGSTLVFYFQGHGDRSKGRTFLVPHDAKAQDLARTALDVDEVGQILAECWKGERLILFADCCHAGALASLVPFFAKKGVRAACLTSAMAANVSTERWTFTEALVSGFAGDGLLDRDRDGKLTFRELDDHVHDEMKFQEHQLARGVRSDSFEEGFVLRGVARPVPAIDGEHRIGAYVSAKDSEGSWYDARIIGARDKELRVHYLGWDAKWDEWVTTDRIRPIAPLRKLEVGKQYEVEWRRGRWFLATVVKAEEDFFWFVHYEGEDGEDDEWVTADRVRVPRKKGEREPPEFRARAPRAVVVGDAVAARWKASWFLAKVTAVDDAKVSVEYADGDAGKLEHDEVIVLAKPGELAEGDRVLACWDGKPQMFPGKVVKKGDACTVAWEDGTKPTEVPLKHLARVK